MTKTIKVLGYVRVSSEEQALHGNGLNGQKGAICEMADKLGYEIIKFYTDGGVSGKYMSRKGLDELLKDLKELNKNPKNPEISFVMVDDIDRLARDIGVRITKKAEIEATGAKILSLKQQLDDTPEAHLMSTISMATKQYERENNGRRVISRQEQRLKDGYWCFRVPLGYKFEKAKDGHGQVVVPIVPDFEIVKEGLKRLADGTIGNKERLRKFLNDRGVRTTKGNILQKSLISRTLTEEYLKFYAGYINFPKRGINMIKGKHEAAINDNELYEICRKFKFDGYYKDFPKDEICKNLPLRQTLICGYCGEKMSGGPARGRGGLYYYYQCFHRGCPHFKKTISNTKIHENIETLLSSLTLDSYYIESIKTIYDNVWNEKGQIKLNILNNKKGEVKDIEKKIEDIINKITNISSELVIKRLEDELTKLLEKKQEIEAEIYTLGLEGEDDDINSSFTELINLIKCPLYLWKTGNFELKSMLLNTIFEGGISYTKEGGVQTLGIPLIYAEKSNIIDYTLNYKKKAVQTTNNLDENYILSDLDLTGGGYRTRTYDPLLVRQML